MPVFFQNKMIPNISVVKSNSPNIEQDVNFYDYDDTLLYSYTKAEALALTELPQIPTTHENLTPDGWNWTLLEIKEQLNSVGYMVDIGALYHPTDGNTHIFYNAYSESKTVAITLTPSVANDVTINWGDGTTDVLSTNSEVTTTHTYNVSTYTKFDISISSDNSYSITNYFFGSQNDNQSTPVDEIWLSSKVNSISANAFGYIYFLKKLILPSVSTYGETSFRNCDCLRCVVFPTSISSFPSMFVLCAVLHIICSSQLNKIPNNCLRYGNYGKINTIPYGVTYVGTDAFRQFYNISEVHLGPNVTQLFGGNGSLFLSSRTNRLYIHNATPPTLSANCINSIIKNIFVPASAVNTYKSTTNWAAYADIIVAIPT